MTIKQHIHIQMQILIIKGKKVSLEYLRLKQRLENLENANK